MKYRKKPIVIEAMKLTRDMAEVVIMWIQENGGYIPEFNLGEFTENSFFLEIETLEGVMKANEGDYIIRGIKGEFYPCQKDIFESTYEPVKDKVTK